MEITRRQFTKLAIIGPTLLTTIELEGCTLSHDVEVWVPIGIASINSIESVLQANGIALSPAAQTYANDSIAALKALVAAAQEYDATTPPPTTTIQKLQTAFKAVTDQLSAFMGSLELPGGNILSLVVGLAGVVFSAIASFANRVPTPVGTTKTILIGATVRVASTSIAVLPKERTKGQYKHDFNADLKAGAMLGLVIPKGAYL